MKLVFIFVLRKYGRNSYLFIIITIYFVVITFTPSRSFVEDPDYTKKKERSFIDLEDLLKKDILDAPIKDIMVDLNRPYYCFTLQSCYGHFAHVYQKDEHNYESLKKYSSEKIEVTYRIAYVALCIQNNGSGRLLLDNLNTLVKIDPRYIQFGSSDWFWDHCVNSYVLQVSPERRRYEDKFNIDMEEALHIENVRNKFYQQLRGMIKRVN